MAPPPTPSYQKPSLTYSLIHSFVHNPQLPSFPTLPQYPLRARPALLPAMLAQMPTLNLLPPCIQHPFVVRLLLGAGVEAAVDGGVERAAEGFAYALLVRCGRLAGVKRSW